MLTKHRSIPLFATNNQSSKFPLKCSNENKILYLKTHFKQEPHSDILVKEKTYSYNRHRYRWQVQNFNLTHEVVKLLIRSWLKTKYLATLHTALIYGHRHTHFAAV